jgi:hypothetical protein
MKKPHRKRPGRVDPDDILPEYDFSQAKRNKYAARLAGSQIVVVDPDLTEVFPNSAAVNEALRTLAGFLRRRRPARPAHPRGKRAATRR